MLKILTSFYGHTVKANDGDAGTVHEFLFEDNLWEIKHVVVKIGDWLTSRKVSVPIEVVGKSELTASSLRVGLTVEEIEGCPALGAEQSGVLPEEFGWLGPMLPGGPAPLPLVPIPPLIAETENQLPESELNVRNLRSTRDVVGCHVQSRREEIGNLEDFVLDDEHWRIRYLAIGTKNRPSGKHILLSPSWISSAQWDENRIYVDLRKESVEKSPEFDPSLPFDRAYEIRLYDYYFGRPFNNDTTHAPRVPRQVVAVNNRRGV